MPLVFRHAISAGSSKRGTRSTKSRVFARLLASIPVPRFLQVFGCGKTSGIRPEVRVTEAQVFITSGGAQRNGDRPEARVTEAS